MGEVIVIVSGKGGTGKSMFASNMGATLAKRGLSIALIDMNTGMRNLDLCLGLESSIVYDLTDAIIGICKTKQTMVRDRRFPGLCLISAPQSRDKVRITPAEMKDFCQGIRHDFDYIIIDAPSGIGEEVKLATVGADRAVIITNPEHSAVRDADSIDNLLLRMGIRNRSIVINRVRYQLMGKGILPEPEEIAEMLQLPVSGIIQEDENILISTNMGIPLIMEEGSYFEKNFNQIIDRILL
ncbi:MAG: septum site-determining protein MinD [Anaerovoracaceae bacterium]|jgi:septum site-determining protein MinD